MISHIEEEAWCDTMRHATMATAVRTEQVSPERLHRAAIRGMPF